MSFDTLAPYYRALEFLTVGGLLQRARTVFLPETVRSRRALLLGEGPGRFLVALLRTNADVEVTCVDASGRMIAQAVREMEGHGLPLTRVRFVQADARAWPSHLTGFDLVATHFFLDCFGAEELGRLVASISQAAAPEATWLLTDFRLPLNGWRRWRGRVLLALLYAFFRAFTGLAASRLTPPDGYLVASGFRLAGRHLADFGFVQSDLWTRSARVDHAATMEARPGELAARERSNRESGHLR